MASGSPVPFLGVGNIERASRPRQDSMEVNEDTINLNVKKQRLTALVDEVKQFPALYEQQLSQPVARVF
jgi:hypothetical protein